jgi:hypothetical protein
VTEHDHRTGKSSLMQAGLLPLIDQGWLWPRTGYECWRRIGTIMPGQRPVEMLAERYRLRERKEEDTAFLLAVDQFEELFTFSNASSVLATLSRVGDDPAGVVGCGCSGEVVVSGVVSGTTPLLCSGVAAGTAGLSGCG